MTVIHFHGVKYCVRYNGYKNPNRIWLCRCDCGNERLVYGSNLTRRRRDPDGTVCGSRSCGCLSAEKSHGHYVGKKESRTLTSYHAMVTRCLKPYHEFYANYGGRGIKICKRWLKPNGKGFRNFLADMGERPEDMTLDRIRVNSGYKPSNCRWATAELQHANRRCSKVTPEIKQEMEKFNDQMLEEAAGPY
jgi:hypothetical protein